LQASNWAQWVTIPKGSARKRDSRPSSASHRTLRKTKKITLQAAADNLHFWPSALSRLEHGQTRDDLLHQGYEIWLNEY
jgi:hypothetical protein